MKKYIIRAGLNPWDNYSAKQLLRRDLLGTNVGNLVYAHSLFRNLMTEEVEIVADNYVIDHKKADEINETYDGYIIPLADAFRSDFAPRLDAMAKLINKLKIPVYVIGVGLRAPYEPHLENGFSFDDSVKRFVSAVLEKSSIIGLRGEITAQYLSNLGFKNGTDHIAIGCPSLYMFGEDLNLKKVSVDSDSRISTNISIPAPENVLGFIRKIHTSRENTIFIPQGTQELAIAYAGGPDLQTKKKWYPRSLKSFEYANDRVRFPLNMKSWLEELSNVDLSFGTKLHGNIVATLAGTPSVTIPLDARMRELVEYHKIPSFLLSDFTADITLEKILEKVNFTEIEQQQKQNFERFHDF